LAKLKKAFFCQNCGAQASKWIGKCPSCNEWNTYVEEIIQKEEKLGNSSNRSRMSKAIAINDVENRKEVRYRTPDEELNRVLGGGLVPGSLQLFGGEPGIGKSTLLLQLALKWLGIKVLYISGEESEQQIKMRAERIGIENSECYLLSETSIQNILQHLAEAEADIVVVDSMQT